MDAALSCLIVGCGYVGARLARREAGRRPRAGDGAFRHGRDRACRSAGIRTLRLDLDAHRPGAAAGTRSRPRTTPPSSTSSRRPTAARPIRASRRSCAGRRFDACGLRLHQHDRRVWRCGRRTVDETTPVAPVNDRSRRRVAAESSRASLVRRPRRALRDPAGPGIYGPHRLPLERLQRRRAGTARRRRGPRQSYPRGRPRRGRGGRDRSPHGAGDLQRDGRRPFEHDDVPAHDGRSRRAARPSARRQGRGKATRIPPGMLSFLLESRRVDNRRMREELGVQLQIPDAAVRHRWRAWRKCEGRRCRAVTSSATRRLQPFATCCCGRTRIAVVGLSDDPARPSYGVTDSMRGLRLSHLAGEPALHEWEGIPAYPDARSGRAVARAGRTHRHRQRVPPAGAGGRRSSTSACGSACPRCGCSRASSTSLPPRARDGRWHDGGDGSLHLRRPRSHAGVRPDSGILRGCGSPSRRCMASATISSCSTPPAPCRCPSAAASCAGSATAARASASTRRWCSSRRAAPAPTSITASSTPTAPKWSSAATARAASRGWWPAVAARSTGRCVMDSPGGIVHARLRRRRPGCGRHGRAGFRSGVAALRRASSRGRAITSTRRRARSKSAPSRSAIRTP